MADYPFDYKEVRALTPEQLFAVLDDWLNCNSSRSVPTGFSKALNSTHRTLQELAIGFLWNVLIQYGRDHQNEFCFDPRNEDAVMLCRKFVELVDKGELPTHLRYI